MVEIFNNTGIYNVPEAAGILKISPSTLRGYVSQGSIPHLKFGSGKSCVRFSGKMLNDWITTKSVPVKASKLINEFSLDRSVGITKRKNGKNNFSLLIDEIKSKKKNEQ